jgi:hypothetical protein
MNQLLASLKRHPALYKFLKFRIYERIRSVNRERIFLNIYENNLWEGDSSVSGPGSSLESTLGLRKALPILLQTLRVGSILDIPCGDFQWMQHVPLGAVQYTGADVVLPLIQKNRKAFGGQRVFLHLDLLRDALPPVDVILCRDCFVHLSFREIQLALRNIKSASPKYFMTTTFPNRQNNVDTVTPYWRELNMQLSPFNFPEPVQLIKDSSDGQARGQGKHLGIWKTAEL